MTSFMKISASVAFAGLALVKGAVPVSADNSTIRLKVFAPLKGVTLDVGSKRAIGYYTANSGACELTLMIAEAYRDDTTATAQPVRVKTTVGSGTSTRVDTQDGPSLQFACAPGASTMTVQPIDRLAYAAPAK